MLNISFEVIDAMGEVVSATTVEVERDDYTHARPEPLSSHIVRIIAGNDGGDIIIISTDMTVDSKTNTKSWCESTICLRPNGAWTSPIVYRSKPLLVFRIKACFQNGTPITGNGFCTVETRTWQTTFTDEDGVGYNPWVDDEWAELLSTISI